MKSKQWIAGLLTAAVSLPALTIGAAAVTAPVQYGDVKFDGIVNIADVTALQRYLAGLQELSYEGALLADFDHSGSITIDDATWIQKYLAEMWIPEEYGGEAWTDVAMTGFTANYDSGKAVPNMPVTFTASAAGCAYEFYVDDVTVQARSENDTLTYAFPAAGEYRVRVRVFNAAGFYRSMSIDYTVVESYDYNALSLTACHILTPNDEVKMLEVQATGGSAPYEYSVKIYEDDWMTGGPTGLSQYDIMMFAYYEQYCEETEWQLCYDERGAYLFRDFTDENTIPIIGAMLGSGNFYAEVCAMDGSGSCSEPESVKFFSGVYYG